MGYCNADEKRVVRFESSSGVVAYKEIVAMQRYLIPPRFGVLVLDHPPRMFVLLNKLVALGVVDHTLALQKSII